MTHPPHLIQVVTNKDGTMEKNSLLENFLFFFGQREKTLQKLSETLGREKLKHNNRRFIRNGNDWYMF